MTTEKQRLANIANAKKSTGPTTSAGRVASSQNALRHGLFAQTICIKGESHECFNQLAEEMIQEHAPRTCTEYLIVQQMVVARWRQHRLWAVEAATIDMQMESQEKEAAANPGSDLALELELALGPGDLPVQDITHAFKELCKDRILDVIRRQDAHFECSYDRAHKMLIKARKADTEHIYHRYQPDTERSHFSDPLKTSAA